MDNPGEITEILRLCRLCLVKDQVNIPIFDEQGDIRQIFLKISSCLPVKVSREDQLPKKICDGCSNKLDLLYEFWNTSANAEKTLLSWLGQAGVKDADETISAVAQQIAKPVEIPEVKEETEPLEDGQVPSHATDSFPVPSSFDEGNTDEAEAPPPKRARRTAAVKAQINLAPESDDDEDDDMDNAEPMTKMEDESDESEGEEKDPSYSEVPGTSADDQAGPSGVGKDGVEAPYHQSQPVPTKPKRNKKKKANVNDVEQQENVEADDVHVVNKFYCHICGYVCKNFNALDQHMLNPPENHWYACRCCEKTFQAPMKLLQHSRKSHGSAVFSEAELKYGAEHPKSAAQFHCDFCGNKFVKLESYMEHKLKSHVNWVAGCPLCNEKFRHTHQVMQHVKKHHAVINNVDLFCQECSHHYFCPTVYMSHMQSVHRKKITDISFQCALCPSVVGDLNDFYTHLHSHGKHNAEHLRDQQVFMVNQRPMCNVATRQCYICSGIFSNNLKEHLSSSHSIGVENTQPIPTAADKQKMSSAPPVVPPGSGAPITAMAKKKKMVECYGCYALVDSFEINNHRSAHKQNGTKPSPIKPEGLEETSEKLPGFVKCTSCNLEVRRAFLHTHNEIHKTENVFLIKKMSQTSAQQKQIAGIKKTSLPSTNWKQRGNVVSNKRGQSTGVIPLSQSFIMNKRPHYGLEQNLNTPASSAPNKIQQSSVRLFDHPLYNLKPPALMSVNTMSRPRPTYQDSSRSEGFMPRNGPFSEIRDHREDAISFDMERGMFESEPISRGLYDGRSTQSELGVKCTDCPLRFDTVESMIQHMKIVHFPEVGLEAQTPQKPAYSFNTSQSSTLPGYRYPLNSGQSTPALHSILKQPWQRRNY